MMKGFEKRQAEREAQKTRDAQEWQSARARFRRSLEAAGASLDPLFVEVHAHSASFDAEWFTWWHRDEAAANASKVQTAVAANYITQVTLHSGRTAEPGERQTGRMWLAAKATGDDVLDAALVLTAIRATENQKDVRQSPAIAEYRRKLLRWSWDTLKAASIDPYTRASRWFLPVLLETDRSARDGEDLVDLIAANLAAFLVRWTPVRVNVRCGVAQASLG